MVIYGASGHGKVIADIIRSNDDQEKIVFVDDADKGKEFYGCKLYKTEDFNFTDESTVIAIGNNLIRKKIAKETGNHISVIHNSAAISQSVSIGKGTVVMANVSCNADTKIGDHVILNTSCSIDHDCEIEDFVHVSPNASLAGNVRVGEGTHIGIGACVIQGIRIGKFATIGAGSVVIRDIPDGVTVVGNPARIINKE